MLALLLGLTGCGGGSHAARAHRSSVRAPAPGTTTTTASATTTTGAATAGAPGSTGTPTTGGPGTAPATSSPAVTYGLGDAPGQFAACRPGVTDCCDVAAGRCSLSQTEGYFDDRLFLRLLTPSSAHQVRDVRLFVPWDAVMAWNGSTSAPGCTYSGVIEHPWSDAEGLQPAGEAINQLIAGVIEARADGLEPMVTITGYPFAGLRPPGDPAFPDPSTVAGHWAYRCGLQGIMSDLSRLPAWEQPHVWEAINEPETFPIFRGGSQTPPATQCDVGESAQPDGPAKAACALPVATQEIHDFAGHAQDTVIAGTFEHPYVHVLDPYAAEVARLMPGAAYPATWSVHDYNEVTGAALGDTPHLLASFDAALARDSGGRARALWITEAGTVLTSRVRAGHCPASGVDAAGSLGACINGQTARQLASARAFFALPAAASAVPITHLFWYQFTGAPLWDSGLVDPAGTPRTPYCLFYGSGTCAGSPNAA